MILIFFYFNLINDETFPSFLSINIHEFDRINQNDLTSFTSEVSLVEFQPLA